VIKSAKEGISIFHAKVIYFLNILNCKYYYDIFISTNLQINMNFENIIFFNNIAIEQFLLDSI